MIEGGAEAVNVAPAVHGRAGQMFRTDVLRGPHDLVILAVVDFPGNLGKTEIGEFRPAVRRQHDIVRFDVAVDQLLFLPRIIQRFTDLLNDGNRLINRNHVIAFQHVLHRFAVNILHGEIENALVLADRVSLHDIGMIQLCRGARLLDESDDEFRIVRIVFSQNLESGGAVEGNLVRKIDDSHSASADFTQNDEIADDRAGSNSRGRNGNLHAAMAALHIRSHIGIVNRYDSPAKWTLKPHSDSVFSRNRAPVFCFSSILWKYIVVSGYVNVFSAFFPQGVPVFIWKPGTRRPGSRPGKDPRMSRRSGLQCSMRHLRR